MNINKRILLFLILAVTFFSTSPFIVKAKLTDKKSTIHFSVPLNEEATNFFHTQNPNI
ncbi:hypothetical protein M670_03178 [Schinkia azotoformans MEV2011]|uniref:Uncharacterized protein n=1 Tax=Schinkia azotoformans MEV2011 TaxID=1348973 RepID=A0A072NK45_SCHAZ|nr:hypothetical protein M670_03178 [Schinkia azotoformans MEV2011]